MQRHAIVFLPRTLNGNLRGKHWHHMNDRQSRWPYKWAEQAKQSRPGCGDDSMYVGHPPAVRHWVAGVVWRGFYSSKWLKDHMVIVYEKRKDFPGRGAWIVCSIVLSSQPAEESREEGSEQRGVEQGAGQGFFHCSVRNWMRQTHSTRFSNFVKIISAVKSALGALKSEWKWQR